MRAYAHLTPNPTTTHPQAPECGHLVFQFRQLQDELPLRHYGIAAESNVHFVGGLPGGKGGFGALLRGQG